MRRVWIGVLLSGAIAVPGSASIVFLGAPGTGIDTVNWASIGGDGTLFSDGKTVNSALNNPVTIHLGTSPALGGLTSVVCPAINPVNCSWTHQPFGYATGDSLLWLEGLDANGNPVGTGPLTINLNPVSGLGAYLQETYSGLFSASLAVYNGASLLGSHTYTSDSAGDPLFVGVGDTVSGEITKAVLTVTACGSFGCDVNDFSVDKLLIFAPIPEPGTFGLSGCLLALGFALRKRFGRGKN
jgi:hypothetical protein